MKTKVELMREVQEKSAAEDATGCVGAGDYREYAKQQGYPHLKVWDWTSSAGDWSFLVSKDGERWVFMFQTNNYPRAGFTWHIDEDGIDFFCPGDQEEALFELVQDYINARCEK